MPRDPDFREPAPVPRPRRRRWPWVLAAVILLPVLAVGVVLASFDLNSQKPRIQEAVRNATGRELALDGPIGLKFSLVPTLTVEGAAFANMPTGSRPQMATVRRLELELALLPLLSREVEVRRLRLVAPDILLETDRDGRPNWVFAPPAARGEQAGPAPAQPERPAEAARETGRRLGIEVGRVSIEQGRVTWRNGATGSSRSLEVPGLEADASGPVRVRGTLALAGTPVAVEAETGPLSGLADPTPGTAWPLRGSIEAAGARFALDGTVGRPAERRGWRATLTASVPELQRLAPLLPDTPLPPLHGLEARIGLADAGPGEQALTALDLTVGDSPLDMFVPGLHLARLHAALPSAEAPLALKAEGALHGTPVRLVGTTRSPKPPQGMQAPVPLDLSLDLGGATATVKGMIADPDRLTGVDLALAAQVPDLAALAPLAGQPLPPVRDLHLQARLNERGGYRFAGGAFLRGIQATSSAGDLAGDLTYVVGMRYGITGGLASRRLDLDALRPPPAAPAAPAAPPPPRDGRVIPDTPLPLEMLRLTDSDVRLRVAELVTGGVTLRDAEAHVVIADGKARFDPLDVTLPGGRLAARAAADVTATPPAVQLALQSDGIDIAPLLAALHQPGGTAGRIELDLDLRGQGHDLRAVAATATGHLGLALTNGSVEAGSGSLLGRALGDLRRELPQLGGGGEGRVAIACAAARFRLEGGLARTEGMLLESSLGKIGGGGLANLRDETLSMRLLLDLRIPVPGVNALRIRAPVPLTGTFASPRPDYGQAATRGAAGLAEGLLQERGGVAGEVLGALGGVPGGGKDPALPDCGPALAAARGGRAGPVPASAVPAEPQPRTGPAPLRDLPRTLPGPAQDMLRGLLGR